MGRFLILLPLAGMLACQAALAASEPVPAPVVDAPRAAAPGKETAILAGGCFWGLQAVFENVKGVLKVTAGYAGGHVPHPTYEQVSSGSTGNAESVEIVFDPSQVTFGELLRVYFSVATDPTQLNRQGPDTGTQYRSVIFYTTPEQKKIAQAYIEQLNQAKVYKKKIVTEVAKGGEFYAAEDYHQDFAKKNPNHPYIVQNDAPKVAALHAELPEMCAR
jgi:peptide-methionine (S)-S-oxide reductase